MAPKSHVIFPENFKVWYSIVSIPAFRQYFSKNNSVRYQPKGQETQTRIMHVSTDHGENFDAVQLPAVSEDQFFSILDANEDMIFMHIDEEGDTGKGTFCIFFFTFVHNFFMI